MSDETTVGPEPRQAHGSEDLLILLKIQDKDIKIRRLKAELEQKPKDLEVLKDNLSSFRKRLEVDRDGLKKQTVEKKTLEVDLDSRIQNIHKYEVQSAQVKTNEEYRAFLKEIEEIKKGNIPLEDKILDLMEKIEEGEKMVVQEEKLLKQEEEKVAARERTMREEIAGISARLTQIEKEKENLLPTVKPDFLQRYQLVFENKEDSAIVTIEHGACGGCHMAITPQLTNEVKRGSHLVLCENCARILCLPAC